ncbi:BglG family transcription antiterminator [Ethanoligenens harbinense]|uniref:BglG family transcription antiterminator n=1 Tax=Ethanoligenens harbinense TaxID=253239 RepID=UPI00131EBDFA|nr:PTS sugar transporter subunit IIA [Ethanoligenens harbinense]
MDFTGKFNITERQFKILHILNSSPNTTVKYISEFLKVSPQTVKTELLNLKPLFSHYNILIDLEKNNQIQINEPARLPRLMNSAGVLLQFPLKKRILLMLVLNTGFLTLQDIADELYVSKSLVEKQMKDLLKTYSSEVKSLRHYGFRYIASQFKRREIFVMLVSPYVQGLDFEESLENFNNIHFPIMRYFTHGDIEKALKIVAYIQQLKNLLFTDKAIGQMFLYQLIVTRNRRLSENTQIGDDFVPIMRQLPYFSQYMSLSEETDRAMQLALPKNEKYYLCYLLINLKKQHVLNSQEIVNDMRPFILDSFAQIKNHLSLDFSGNEKLLEGLALHIHTTLSANDNHYAGNNYGWDEMKGEYPLGFEAATVMAQMILSKYGKCVTDNELIYLTIHFQNAIEQMYMGYEKIRAVVICHYGVAAANLIRAKVEKLYPEIDVTNLFSLQEFNQAGKIDCDLIITTEKLEANGIKVIYVSPALKQSELKQFQEFIEDKKSKDFLKQIIREAIVLDLSEVATKYEIISKMAERLEKEQIVTSQYKQSVLEREEISSTDYQAIATPHGNPHYVMKTKLCIARLTKEVEWGDAKVKYAFMLACSTDLLKSSQSTFSLFYHLLTQTKFENFLVEVGDIPPAEFLHEFVKLLY